MNLVQLLVLLWKNWILHRRYFLITSFEILSPVLLSLVPLLALAAESSYKEDYLRRNVIRHNMTIYDLFDPVKQFSSSLMLLYAPITNGTKDLMETALKHTQLDVRGYPTEAHIVNETNESYIRKKLWGTIVFANFDGTTIPSSLQYTLSLFVQPTEPADPLEKTYYEGQIRMRLKDESLYKTSGFLAVQILIDLTYIAFRQKKIGLTMPNVQILIKRLPLPRFTSVDVIDPRIIIVVTPFYVCTGLLFFFVVVAKRVVDEKNNKAKELMKMMGMSTTDYWGSTFISNFLVAVIVCVIVTLLYLIPISGKGSVLRNTSASLFLVIILLYCASSLLLCFVVTTVFTKHALAITVIVAIWISTIALASSTKLLTLEFLRKIVACLIPNLAIQLALLVTFFHELTGIGSGWDNIMQPSSITHDNFSVGSAIIMMLISCIIYTGLLLYLDSVWPWQPGVPLPPLFFLRKSYWYPSHNIVISAFKNGAKKSKYFEDDPIDLTPTVVIYHLTKVFGRRNKKIAVENLCLSMYHGQITALLGHNGAGKSTTMNMLTGIILPTSGTAIINGCDIVKDTNAARSNLGLCPEYCVLYESLTVDEHLKLFAGLKGKRWWAMGEEIASILRQLHLLDKQEALTHDLSGGMRRQLSLANAIIGNPEILILDEPTTGLDPESRRCVWSLLEELRPKCTMLLTTHYMEEADALGDRIAIMASGNLQCCGSSMFLKRVFGAGYHLRVERGPNCQIDAITTLIQRYVPEARLTREAGSELIYSLSNEATQYKELFQELESSYQRFGILSCGVDVTTMDEVFMRVGEMTSESYQTKEKDRMREVKNKGTLVKQSSVKVTNGQRIAKLQQMEALLVKRAQYAKRNPVLLIFQVAVPLAAIFFFIQIDIILRMPPDQNKTKELVFGLCNNFKDKKYGLFYAESNESDTRILTRYYKTSLKHQCAIPLDSSSVGDPERFLLAMKDYDIRSYVKKYLVGATVMESGGNISVVAWFNGVHYHLDPTSINIVTNSLLRFLTKADEAKIIIKVRYLREPTKESKSALRPSQSIENSFEIVFVPIGLSFLSSSFVLFPVQERVSRVKLLQKMCGISGTMYWMTNFLWDFLIHASSSLIMIIPFFFYYISSAEISFDAVGGIFSLLLLYGLSSIPFTYLVSFIVNAPSSGFSFLTLLNMLVGTTSTIAMIVFVKFIPEEEGVQRIMWFLRLFPNFATSWGVKNIYYRSKNNVECSGYDKVVLFRECGSQILHHCCTNSVVVGDGYIDLPYYSWDDFSAGKECFALFIMFFVWSGLTILVETNIVEKIVVFIMNIKFLKELLTPYKERRSSEESDVHNERAKIENIVANREFNKEALIAYELTKDFRSLRAVNMLTFCVHKEECFGLLGVNGAGKTTTFRMLTGDLIPSSGDAFIEQASLQSNITRYQMEIGYCPQSGAYLDQLSARETLQLFARLRGIPKDEVDDNVKQMITMCDLEDFIDKEIYTYSGGTKRKLSLAIALIGAPPIILLDEPTAGVDPVSRRKIWKALNFMKDVFGVSFILTSHSMDECESLCDRIAIMVNGEFRCLGSMQSLKSKFGQGYTIVAKLKQPAPKAQPMKMYIQQNIPGAQLKGDYHGTLHYHTIDTSLKWSRMFTVMEEAKERFNLEDYAVSGTRLEQIFLSFAREQKGFE